MKVVVEELSEKIAIKVEEYIRLCLRPKPKWLPDFIWRKILHRLLILEYLRENF